MREYDKLVRDRIPEIIEKEGRPFGTSTVTGDGLLFYLDKKLDEEIGEFRESRDPEELADVMEVVFAMAASLGVSEKELMDIRCEKKEKRGGFEKGIVLDWTDRCRREYDKTIVQFPS